MWSSTITKTAGTYTLDSSYIGKLVKCDCSSGSVTFVTADPTTITNGDIGFIKTDNSSGYIKLVGGINTWNHVVLAMQNDFQALHNDDDGWYPWGASAGAVRGAPRPHRTVIATNYPSAAYNIGEADLGGVVRCRADNPGGFNLNMPSPAIIGRPAGYSAATDIRALKTPESTYNVDLQGTAGASVNRVPRYPLPTGREVAVDSDGAEWITEAGS